MRSGPLRRRSRCPVAAGAGGDSGLCVLVHSWPWSLGRDRGRNPGRSARLCWLHVCVTDCHLYR